MARTRHIATVGLDQREQNNHSARLKLSIKRAERRDRQEQDAQAWIEARRTHPLEISAQEETSSFVRWAQASLRAPQTGQPFQVADGVSDWLQKALDRPESGLLSETQEVQEQTLCALLLYFLAGPRVYPAFRAIVASPTPASTAQLREQLAAYATAANLLHPDGPLYVTVNPYPGEARSKLSASVRFQSLSSEETGHAIAADLICAVSLDPDAADHRHAYNRLSSATATSRAGRLWRFSHVDANRLEWTS